MCCPSPAWPILSPPWSSLQGTSRPTRSLSTAQLVQPSGGLQASVISNIVLMKGQAKVSRATATGWTLGQHQVLRRCRVEGREELVSGDPGPGCESRDAAVEALGGSAHLLSRAGRGSDSVPSLLLA